MIITRGDYSRIRWTHKDQTIVYCSGNFDLTHARHILFLSRCKAQGDILVVGVGPDHDIRRNKGSHRPIHNEQIRLYTVDNLKPVDYCSLNPHMKKGYHRLHAEKEALRLLQPNIYTINDDAFDISYRQSIAKELGVQLSVSRREENIPLFLKGISTTNTIELVDQMRMKELQAEQSYIPSFLWQGWTKYRPVPNAGIILLNSDKQVLLFRRASGPNEGKWEPSGGAIDKAETPIEAALRELKEETGIELTNSLTELGTFRAENQDKTDIITMFLAHVPKDTPIKLGDEFNNAQWISLEQAIRLPMHPTNREILRRILE